MFCVNNVNYWEKMCNIFEVLLVIDIWTKINALITYIMKYEHGQELFFSKEAGEGSIRTMINDFT